LNVGGDVGVAHTAHELDCAAVAGERFERGALRSIAADHQHDV